MPRWVLSCPSTANTQGCKNPDDDPHEDLGDDYKNGLTGWCRTKRASSIIGWLALGCWIGLLIFSGLAFREDRKDHREPAFIPPSSPGAAESGMVGRTYDQINDRDDVFADKYEATPTRVQPGNEWTQPQPRPYSYGQPGVLAQQDPSSALSRPSVDAYGAFDGDMPGARASEPSRTMQMAYSDPYADVRAQVMADGGFGQPTPPPQHGRPSPYPY